MPKRASSAAMRMSQPMAMPTPAADAVAVDHGEERLLETAERGRTAPGDAAVLLLVGHVPAAVLELGDVGARHERALARAAQDDHADRIVAGQIGHVPRHELPHLLAHGIAPLGLLKVIQPIGPSLCISSPGVSVIALSSVAA
jgi:hypothetical protein